MCITESINIDSYQANLKAFIQHDGTTQNGHSLQLLTRVILGTIAMIIKLSKLI